MLAHNPDYSSKPLWEASHLQVRRLRQAEAGKLQAGVLMSHGVAEPTSVLRSFCSIQLSAYEREANSSTAKA